MVLTVLKPPAAMKQVKLNETATDAVYLEVTPSPTSGVTGYLMSCTSVSLSGSPINMTAAASAISGAIELSGLSTGTAYNCNARSQKADFRDSAAVNGLAQTGKWK